METHMHYRIIKIATIVAIAFAVVGYNCSYSNAGAWTLSKGKIYDKLSLNYYYADDQFDKNGDRLRFDANGDFSDINGANYIEYGITDSVTLINSLYFKYIEKDDDLAKTTTYGIGDIDLAMKVKLLEGKAGIFSAQGLVKIPEAYDRHDRVPLGNGQYDVELKLLYGISLWPYLPGYCGVEGGYRWRFSDPADEFRYLVEFGIDLPKDFYGRVKLDGIYSIDNGTHSDSGGNPTATNNFDLGKLDVTLGYKINPSWGVEASYTPEIYGQNTAAGATYTLAVTYQLR
jgi:hypothetical protein